MNLQRGMRISQLILQPSHKKYQRIKGIIEEKDDKQRAELESFGLHSSTTARYHMGYLKLHLTFAIVERRERYKQGIR